MEKFTYKVALFTHEVEAGKEMITYKGKTVPGSTITGLGFSLVKISSVITGQLIGGIVGGMITNRGFEPNVISKDMTSLPEGAMGQIIITYCEDGTHQKVLRISVTTGDPNCLRLMEYLAATFPDKFIGFGGQPVIEKALKISQKWAYLVVAIVLLGIFGFAAFAISQGY